MSLKRYIQGYRKGKEAHRIEREALKDPFLYEALEGFDAVQEDHAKRIEELQRSITKAALPRSRSWLRWSAAASILLLASLGGYLFLTNPEGDTKSLISQNIENESAADLLKDAEQAIQIEQAELAKEQADEQEQYQDRRLSSARSSQEKRTPTVVVPIQMNALQAEQEAVSVDILVAVDTAQSKAQAVADKAPAKAPIVADTATKKLGDKFAAVADAIVGKDSTKGDINKAISGIISGIIVDQYGEPLTGAYIMQKGTVIGTASNIDGRFELKIDTTKNLSINYIGFLAQEIPVKQFSNSMKITLVEDQSVLAESVVVAYGNTKRGNERAAASRVEVKESEPIIGKRAYEQYLEDNMIHPLNEQGKMVKGKVKLSFYIDSLGRPINITIEKSLGDAADAEAIRLIKDGSDWTLGDKKVEWTISF
jgi:Membrane protein involved in colicin uptake